MAERLSKFSDNPVGKDGKHGFLQAIVKFAASAALKIVMLLLFFILLIPIMCYALFCMFFGKQPTINVKKLMQYSRKSANGSNTENKRANNAARQRAVTQPVPKRAGGDAEAQKG